MLCPNCAHFDTDTATFCRRCGVRLPLSPDSIEQKQADGRLNAMITFNAISAVFAFTSMIMLAATYVGRPEAKWSIYVVFAFCIVIAVHQSISFGFALDLRMRLMRERQRPKTSEPLAPPGALPSAATSSIADLPYVTEQTTDLLPREARRAPTTGEMRSPRAVDE